MNKKIVKNIKLAFFLNLSFTVLELVGGILTNSISIISNSLHDFANSISIGISYRCEKRAHKRPDNKYTFGYRRLSLIGALISSIFLTVSSILIFMNVVPRIFSPMLVEYNGMIILALFGLCINGLAVYQTRKGGNINEKAINLHMLEDVISWVAVLVGSVLIKVTGIYAIDPILSLVIALYILIQVFRHLAEIIGIFLEKIPDDVDIKELKHNLKEEYKDILELHQIHVWTLDGITNYLTMNIVVKESTTKKEIMELKESIKKDLAKENIEHVTIEFDYASIDQEV